MRKQKIRRARAIHQSPNDAGVIGNRIADLMLYPLHAAADAVVAKKTSSERRGEGKTRATERKRPRK